MIAKALFFLAPFIVYLSGDLIAGPPTAVTFPAKDGLAITANVYKANEGESKPFIVLFRQAGWSQGKYREIGPRLNRLGFNCMAVDQRLGHRVNGVENETAKQAKAADKQTGYVDALPDIDAAIKYTRQHHAANKIIIWGSSYSASLVLKLAGEKPK